MKWKIIKGNATEARKLKGRDLHKGIVFLPFCQTAGVNKYIPKYVTTVTAPNPPHEIGG